MTTERPQEGLGTPDVTFAELTERRRGPLRRYLREHPLVVDGLVCAGYLGATIVPILFADPGGRWLELAVTLLIAGLLFFRRRRALLVLALVFVLESAALFTNPVDSPAGVGLWVALYTAATRYTARRMFTLAVLISAVEIMTLVVWVYPFLMGPAVDARNVLDGEELPPDTVWFVAAFMLALNLAAVAIGAAVRNNRLHDAELANWGRRVQTLAQATERNRIAREMHDVVAHSLSVMIALSDGAAVVLKRDPDRAAEVLSELSSTGRGALADMRRVIGVLRDGSNAPLAPQPASSSLREMLEGFRVAGVPLRFSHAGPELPADAAFQLTVYRIVQESLTNVLRYGRAVTRVGVEVSREGQTVRIKVTDNGQQAGSARETIGSGQGLKGIAERTSIYDGSVYAGPGPQGGWVVHAILTAPEDDQIQRTNKGEKKDEQAGSR